MYKASQKKPTRNKKKLFTFIGLIVLFIVLIGALFLVKKSRDNAATTPSNPSGQAATTDGVNLNPPSAAEVQNAESEKVQKIETPKTSTTEADKVVISSLSQDPTGKDLIAITELHGQGWTSCDLVITSGTSTVTKSADVVYQAAYSSCAGFSVPAKDLPGDTLTVQLIGKKGSGNPVTSEVKTIQVKR